MKKVLLMTVIAVAVMSFIGCGKKYRDLAEIEKSGELVVFTDARWAPYEYMGDGGKVEGIDIDIANAIANDLGVKLRIINADFDGFSLAIQNGQADIAVSAITITKEREESLDFSIPYDNSRQYIIKKENNNSIQSLNDLAGLRIGVHLGTTGDFIVSDQINNGVLKGTGAQVVQYKSLQEAILALKKGDLGAVVCDIALAKNLATVNKGLSAIEGVFADGSIQEELYGVAVAKGNTKLLEAVNKSLTKLLDSGAIDKSKLYHSENSAITK